MFISIPTATPTHWQETLGVGEWLKHAEEKTQPTGNEKKINKIYDDVTRCVPINFRATGKGGKAVRFKSRETGHWARAVRVVASRRRPMGGTCTSMAAALSRTPAPSSSSSIPIFFFKYKSRRKLFPRAAFVDYHHSRSSCLRHQIYRPENFFSSSAEQIQSTCFF